MKQGPLGSFLLRHTLFGKAISGNFARALFIVSLTYRLPIAEVEKHLAEHRKFLKKHYQQGLFFASGPKIPREGGIIIASVPDRASLDEILSQDPFFVHKVADYSVTEFVPTMNSSEFEPITRRDKSFRK